ncbi:Protein N-acetyltransferase, RimJ/RimL family [Mucilaginibacter lappiensis]|uniref:RimJ/RimL family protein N-acetyltransferase n=1 Tax=Mucilaginibacter lappiensis TaxID=354630 RepID=A0ABR6PNH9_9SPHI|nr:GNAT family N-acetyltransferase [Mucilaginibacter lappiensis]MBB6111148.1 RimJ/RimL family protein N-acetyltransferase [Mucilaginibacter lappiensis]SIR70281.1 Protein N-acetyltransferase, RimJ/RimL family [Mucilaginibacter lappiensis]
MNSKFSPEADYILEDDWVLIRPLTTDDYKNLLPFALYEPNTWKYSPVGAQGADGLRNYMDIALKAKLEGKEYPFIIYDKKTGEYAGSTRFYDIQPVNQALEIGYTWYGEKFRGTGLNKHCKFLLLQLAFEELDMKRVGFRADARNERSIAAMKSIGCTVEGIIRSHLLLPDGSRRDSILLSILQHEWQQEVKEKLIAKL